MSVILIYIICYIFRIFESFILRTDQSIFGELFIHKIIGIIILVISLKYFRYSWVNIGFKKDTFLKNSFVGLLFGLIVFLIAYGIEFIIQMSNNNYPHIRLFVTAYSTEGNIEIIGGIELWFLCIIGNIINVIMEEGIFRGLFLYRLERKKTFLSACIISSILFGLWHIVSPLRNYFDGNQSAFGTLMSSIMLIITTTLVGIQFCMIYKIIGSLWFGMIFHFINNTSTNLIHIETITGIDELMILRIAIAQTISFIVILIVYIIKVKKKEYKNSPNYT